MAIHSRKGSLAARPMIRSDVQHCPIRFSTGGVSPHLLIEDSRSGLKCLITVIVSPMIDSLGPIQSGTCSAYLGNRRHIETMNEIKRWLGG